MDDVKDHEIETEELPGPHLIAKVFEKYPETISANSHEGVVECKLLQNEAMSPDCCNSSSNKLNSSDTTISSLGISASYENTDFEDSFLCNMDRINIDLPVA